MSNDRRFMPVAIEKSWKDKYGFPGSPMADVFNPKAFEKYLFSPDDEIVIAPHVLYHPFLLASFITAAIYDGQGYEPTAAQMNVAMAVSQDFVSAAREGGEVLSRFMKSEEGKIVRGSMNGISPRQFAAEAAWRLKGRNIVQLSPDLTFAFEKTSVSIIPDDFHLPVSPLYIAVPPNLLPLYDDVLDLETYIDGFMVQEIDFFSMAGEVTENLSREEDDRGGAPAPGRMYGDALIYDGRAGRMYGDALIYDDAYTAPFGGVPFGRAFSRFINILGYGHTPPGLDPAEAFFIQIGIPLNFEGSIETWLEESQGSLKLLEDYGEEALRWMRVIFNTVLYMNSPDADVEEMSGLTKGQQMRVRGMKTPKQRARFKEKHAKRYRLVKLGSSFVLEGRSGTGTPLKSEHIVRGHWKHQRFGSGLEKTRNVWIKPYIRGKGLGRTDTPRVYKNPY